MILHGISIANAHAFPGLINSHDHLDFNLFPLLGNRVYQHYTDWGNDIHANNKEAIEQVLKVPASLRTQWGLYKNLLNGFTRVINHGAKLEINEDWITVSQDHHAFHSVAFEKNWKWKLNDPFRKNKPFVMHVGEGTGEPATKEINQLIKWNLFRRKIIAVHGVAMNEKQAGSFKGLVWCPASNYFLLNKTAAIDRLKHHTPVVFGTDSTLTSSWNAWEQIRMARKTGMFTDDELFASLTSRPAALWGWNDLGKTEVNMNADIVVAKKKENFFSTDPEDILLVIHKGKVSLFDETLLPQMNNSGIKDFGSIAVNGKMKYVPGDIAGLVEKIKNYGVKINI